VGWLIRPVRRLFGNAPSAIDVVILAALWPSRPPFAPFEIDDGESAITQIYEWRHARVTSIVTTMLGAAASLLVGVAIAVLKHD
jgi:hypothetical protein